LLPLRKEDFEAMKYSPIDIAKTEFEKGVLPITIKRPLPIKTKA